MNLIRLFYVLLSLNIFIGCADSNYLDKTKINSSVIKGNVIAKNDAISKRIVYIAFDFQFKNNKPFDRGICTGIILNQTHILTAAHCAKNYENSRVLTINNIHTDVIKKDQIYKIKKATVHADYDQSHSANAFDNLKYDIAIFELDKKLNSAEFDSQYFDQIKTEDFIKTEDSKNLNPTVTGYGRSETVLVLPKNITERSIHGVLRKALVEFEDYNYGQKLIFIKQHNAPGICGGDSGGPLFVYRNNELYLQGLNVAVEPDGPGDVLNNDCNGTGIVLNLDFYKDWIKEKMAE